MKSIVEKIWLLLTSKELTVSVAESCTGGLVSSLLTDISGSSAYTTCNFVTYSNEFKVKILDVKDETLIKFGAVSEQTAIEMAFGTKSVTKCDIGLSVTGIAGPTGGTKDKPVGLCYICVCNSTKHIVKKIIEPSGELRKELKNRFAFAALSALEEFLIQNY